MLPRLIGIWLMLLLGITASLGCSRSPPSASLDVAAYVWQRLWSPELGRAVMAAPPGITALHVLASEWAGEARSPTHTVADVAAMAASRREVVVVMRIGGTAPLDDILPDQTVALARAWREQGVRVVGLEIDHDCATARLPAYRDWLLRLRSSLPDLPLTITALPTWLGSPSLPSLAEAADEVVVQVHTITAPHLFDPTRARRDLESWSCATRRGFRVALPTYRTRLKDGSWLEADPAVLGRFVAELRDRPIQGLNGVVWFRLGHRGDPNAWSATALAAVMSGRELVPRITPRLVADESGALDVVLENRGTVDAEVPGRLAFAGDVEVLDGVQGFFPQGSTLMARTPPRLRAGDAVVIGFVRGKGISVNVP
jgi:hypothetical protein